MSDNVRLEDVWVPITAPSAGADPQDGALVFGAMIFGGL